MNPGYVYILTNVVMPNLIKIGFTKRSPEERKRELSKASGVPVNFEIKYEIYTHDMKELEHEVHLILEKYRINKNKEFFEFDLFKAIDVLRNCAEELRLRDNVQVKGVNEINELYESIEILGDLVKIYPNMIRQEISSIRIYQTKLRCYLEVTEDEFITKYESRETLLVNQKIQRQDMAFVMGSESDFDSLLFDPENYVSKNARLFIYELDDYSKLVCCSEIFNDYGCQKIQDEHFKNNKSK